MSYFCSSKINAPNYNYLEQKLGIENSSDLKDRMLKQCATIDMEGMARTVQSFLFNSKNVSKVGLFDAYIRPRRL